MRQRISWLVLATTSTVVVSFVIPLCLLVRNLAEERALSATDQEARNIAIAVAQLHDRPGQLRSVFATFDAGTVAVTGVQLPDGSSLGDTTGMAEDPAVAKAVAGGASQTARDDDGAEVVIPVLVGTDTGTGVGTAVVRSRVTQADLRTGVLGAWAGILGLGVALLALALALASRLSSRISEPLRQVAGVAHRLREGDLHARAPVRGTEETQELGRALNGLAERTVELLEAERATVGDLSHRLRTPVTALRLDAEAVTDPELASRLQEHIATLQVTIDTIVAEARRPVRSDLRPFCDAAQAVRARVAFWQVLAEDQLRPMTVIVPESQVLVPLVEEDLTDVVDVLIDNVFAHTAEGTPFEVTLTALAGQVSLVVADEGPGLVGAAPKDRPGSTGLGLDIARRTAADAGGELRIGAARRGADGEWGTRVELRLPMVER